MKSYPFPFLSNSNRVPRSVLFSVGTLSGKDEGLLWLLHIHFSDSNHNAPTGFNTQLNYIVLCKWLKIIY